MQIPNCEAEDSSFEDKNPIREIKLRLESKV